MCFTVHFMLRLICFLSWLGASQEQKGERGKGQTGGGEERRTSGWERRGSCRKRGGQSWGGIACLSHHHEICFLLLCIVAVFKENLNNKACFLHLPACCSSRWGRRKGGRGRRGKSRVVVTPQNLFANVPCTSFLVQCRDYFLSTIFIRQQCF